MAQNHSLEFFSVTFPEQHVAHVEIDRAQKLNAFYEPMWINLGKIFNAFSVDPEVRCIILSGKGEKGFTAGLDVDEAGKTGILVESLRHPDGARQATRIRRHILEFQGCVSAIEKCEKPVIVVLHGFSFGLAIDIASAADIRICAANTKFCVKEVDIGLAADIGTLTRLPKLGCSLSWVKDVCLTARVFAPPEALAVGFVSAVLPDKTAAVARAVELAALVAAKSPVAVQGTKAIIEYSREHGIDDGLQYTAVWNAAMLQTSDVTRAMQSAKSKRKPTFEKL